MMKIAAVLTGDLIGSTKAGVDVADRAMERLSHAAKIIAGWAGADTRFTRFRGDGWQIYIDVPGLVLRSAILLTAALRSHDPGIASRIAAGIDDVRRVGDTDLSDANGGAFVVSGHALDNMAKTRRLVLEGRDYTPGWQPAFFHVADWQSQRWSPMQAEAVAMALDAEAGPRADIAARLGITRQALQARLNGAGFDALESMMSAFEDHDYTRLTP